VQLLRQRERIARPDDAVRIAARLGGDVRVVLDLQVGAPR
jgi:hypothetical protein